MVNFNVKEGIKAVFASDTELQLRLHWILRLSSALCFIGHGAWGVIKKSEWLPFYDVFNVPHDLAYMSMPFVGWIDILLGILLLWRPLPAVLLYMAIWAVFTAMLRPLAGFGWSEFLERGGNYGAPLAMMFLMSVPAQFKEWFEVQKEPAFTKIRQATLAWHLRVYTAILMIGHGGFGVIHQKDMLIEHFRSIGFSLTSASGKSFMIVFGGIEIILGLLILLKPTRGLALFIVFWKLATEFLYVVHGPFFWNVFEFIERWGSYGCPLALYYLLASKSAFGRADTTLNVRFNKVLLFLCLFVVTLLVMPKNILFKAKSHQVQKSTVVGSFAPRSGTEKKLAPGEVEVPDFPIEQLKHGGYVVFLRHTPRNIEADEKAGQQRNVHDRLSVCSEATRLNELGVEYAEIIAVQMRRLNIPLGEIITSTSCRTQHMRRLMFPTENYMTMKEMLYIYAREPGANHAAYNSVIIDVLTKAVAHGQNRIILAHKNVIRHDTIGFMINLEEGDAAIFKPTGRYGEFNIVGRIPIQAWLDLHQRTEQ